MVSCWIWSSSRVAGCAFVVELGFLGGRDALAGYDVHALVNYEEA